MIKRRNFLLGAVGSTCALTCKKLAGLAGPANAEMQASGASHQALARVMAAERAAIGAVFAAGNRCPHLLSPLRVRNKVLKNRILHTVSPTYFMQGPENFPTEMYRNHMSNIAKNAAIVTLSTHFGPYPKTFVKGDNQGSTHFSDDTWQDIPPVHNYLAEMVDDIRYQGAMIFFAGNTGMTPVALQPLAALAVLARLERAKPVLSPEAAIGPPAVARPAAALLVVRLVQTVRLALAVKAPPAIKVVRADGRKRATTKYSPMRSSAKQTGTKCTGSPAPTRPWRRRSGRKQTWSS